MDKDVSLNDLSVNLLKDWCASLLHYQLTDVHSTGLDGRLICPACSMIHARCGDAIYPLLFMVNHSGESKYLESALALYNWMESNESWYDGSWVNMVKSKNHGNLSPFLAPLLWLKRSITMENYWILIHVKSGRND